MQETVKVKSDGTVLGSNVEQKFPTNIVELPSTGLLYPENHPLSKGTVEMKWMTGKEENILTTESYIKNDTVIDKFLESMVVSPKFKYDDLLIGDKDALIIASRIYGHGEEYTFTVATPSGNKQEVTVNLNDVKHLSPHLAAFNGQNSFEYSFVSKKTGETIILTFKFLTVGDNNEIKDRLKKYKKVGSPDAQVTSRLFQMITSVNGDTNPMIIKAFVENDFFVQDSRKFREYVKSIQPGIDTEIEVVDEATGEPFRSKIDIGLQFFWPDAGV